MGLSPTHSTGDCCGVPWALRWASPGKSGVGWVMLIRSSPAAGRAPAASGRAVPYPGDAVGAVCHPPACVRALRAALPPKPPCSRPRNPPGVRIPPPARHCLQPAALLSPPSQSCFLRCPGSPGEPRSALNVEKTRFICGSILCSEGETQEPLAGFCCASAAAWVRVCWWRPALERARGEKPPGGR